MSVLVCVCFCVWDTADSVGMDEGDPGSLPPAASPPDIDPSSPTQFWLKDSMLFRAFLTFF